MPKFSVSKTRHINASPEKVFAALNDFHAWKEWSPWLIMDPNTKVDVAPDNKSYEWNGKRTGSGNMKILSETANQSIDYDLNFLKPFKSHASVSFEVEASGEGTDVTWNMDSSLPFFLFFMKKMMVATIGSDYDRGLNLLKDYVQDGKINSKLNFLGESEFPGCTYIGITRSVDMDAAPKQMKANFDRLMEYASGLDGAYPESAFSQYHKWDFAKGIASFTAGVPVKEVPADLPSDITSGSLPKTKIHTLEHVGPYEHLGNAWTTMYNMQRGKEFKIRKDVHPFETYGNSPNDTAPNELITHVNFAVK